MSKIDYQALREAAEKATWGDWGSYKPHRGARGYEVRLSSQAIAQHVLKNNAEFIAAFNPKVALALLDELERNQQYIKRRDQENEEIALTVGKLRVELEETKSKLNEQREYYEGVIADGSKRIAELESNEVREVGNQFLVVRHPGKTPAIKHCTGDLEDFLRKLIEQDPLVTIDIITHRYYGVGGQWVQDAGEYLQMMQGAGIGVKHQEDSVDSDVSSRNQPGMVVAVHIDAGDFVKFKGQVFEVEETDFDDHDVTLWFVGGNTLKCAAGCQVEVVSAPVAAGIKVKGE